MLYNNDKTTVLFFKLMFLKLGWVFPLFLHHNMLCNMMLIAAPSMCTLPLAQQKTCQLFCIESDNEVELLTSEVTTNRHYIKQTISPHHVLFSTSTEGCITQQHCQYIMM